MDVTKLGKAESCRNREDNHDDFTVTELICRETGDHVHFPHRRRATSPRSHHAPPPIFSSPVASVRYSECRKNQAAGIGATAYDGCGEFVAAGDDSMKCAACGCHRSFHRRESSADAAGSTPILNCAGSAAAAAILKAFELSSMDFRQIYWSPSRCIGGKTNDSPVNQDRKEKEQSICVGRGKDLPEDQDGKEKERPISGGGGEESAGNRDRKAKERRICCGDAAETGKGKGKRYKTKFTAEQTERMREYAERLRWRMSNDSGGEVEKFCEEIGVERERFRIWINNHKNK